MHLALLMTNTDESDFAQKHPKDGEKFTSLIKSVRPEWRVTSFPVKDGVFPKNLDGFDGIMISGSPASLLKSEPWRTRLLDEIRNAYADGTPIFGACFGHQAVAKALGGEVTRNPAGWAFGSLKVSVVDKAPWLGPASSFHQYGAHVDHVTRAA